MSEPGQSARELLDLGWRARDVYDVKRADILFRQSHEAARREGDRQAEVKVLLALADNALHYNHSDDTNAFDCREWYARRSLELSRQIGDREGTADAMVMLAGQLDYQEAVRTLEKAVAIAHEADYPKGVVLGTTRWGNWHL